MQELNHELIIKEKINKAVQSNDTENVNRLIDLTLRTGYDARHIKSYFFETIEYNRKNLMSNKIALPEFLITMDTSLSGLEYLFTLAPDTSLPNKKIVIGVVKGDPHDLGKNIISKVYKIFGFHVIDLGRDIDNDDFTKSVIGEQADILALSGMMSTTIPAMKDIIEKTKKDYPKIKVIVGGASLSQGIAEDFGADTYADTVQTVIEKTNELLDARDKEAG